MIAYKDPRQRKRHMKTMFCVTLVRFTTKTYPIMAVSCLKVYNYTMLPVCILSHAHGSSAANLDADLLKYVNYQSILS